jgi:hypothetical protein
MSLNFNPTTNWPILIKIGALLIAVGMVLFPAKGHKISGAQASAAGRMLSPGPGLRAAANGASPNG